MNGLGQQHQKPKSIFTSKKREDYYMPFDVMQQRMYSATSKLFGGGKVRLESDQAPGSNYQSTGNSENWRTSQGKNMKILLAKSRVWELLYKYKQPGFFNINKNEETEREEERETETKKDFPYKEENKNLITQDEMELKKTLYNK